MMMIINKRSANLQIWASSPPCAFSHDSIVVMETVSHSVGRGAGVVGVASVEVYERVFVFRTVRERITVDETTQTSYIDILYIVVKEVRYSLINCIYISFNFSHL